MNYIKIKKIVSVLFICIGAIAILSEFSLNNKNYYIKSAGLIFLMLGLFMVNATIKSKINSNPDQHFEEEE
ncbi:hypothetical protein [Aquimarina longa]|uniref:hypothetical protein n=1 Tax=Aquimarina longa TaxID=1080221 RepID=UPI00078592CF|nr:hypothetical protein [Aquimarina longa]